MTRTGRQRRTSAYGATAALGLLLAVPACETQSVACSDLARSDLTYEGRIYRQQGSLTRAVDTAGNVGTGTRPLGFCTGEPSVGVVEVSAVPGVPVSDAVLVGDELFVAGPMSARLRMLTEPVQCATRGAFTLTGQWYETEDARRPGVPPYTVLLHVDGSQPDLAAYDRTELEVQVTRSTTVPTAEELARLRGRTISVRVRCDGDRFRALSVS